MSNSDLETYSRVTLRDIANHIDAEAHPERYSKVMELLSQPANPDLPEETIEEVRQGESANEWMTWISIEMLICTNRGQYTY